MSRAERNSGIDIDLDQELVFDVATDPYVLYVKRRLREADSIDHHIEDWQAEIEAHALEKYVASRGVLKRAFMEADAILDREEGRRDQA